MSLLFVHSFLVKHRELIECLGSGHFVYDTQGIVEIHIDGFKFQLHRYEPYENAAVAKLDFFVNDTLLAYSKSYMHCDDTVDCYLFDDTPEILQTIYTGLIEEIQMANSLAVSLAFGDL